MATLPTLPAGRRRPSAAMDELADRDRLAARMLPMMDHDQPEQFAVPYGKLADAPTLRDHLERALRDPDGPVRRARTEQMLMDLMDALKRAHAMEG